MVRSQSYGKVKSIRLSGTHSITKKKYGKCLIFIRIAAVCLIVFIVIVAVTRYVSLGSLVISVLFLVGLVVDGQMGMFGMAQKYLFEMYGIGVLFVLSAFIRHRANIGRLRNGTESKISFSKKKNKR